MGNETYLRISGNHAATYASNATRDVDKFLDYHNLDAHMKYIYLLILQIQRL